MRVALDCRLIYKYFFIIYIFYFSRFPLPISVSQSVMDLYYNSVGGGNATYWIPPAINVIEE